VSGPSDIRDADRDRYWEEFETRWTGLLSYRYLGRSHVGFDRQADPGGRDTMRLRYDMRNTSGGVMAAPLCIAAPESGGFSDLNAVPNPIVASMQIVDPAADVAEIEIVRDVVRTGRTTGFSRSRIVDAADPRRTIALSEGVGVTIGPAPPGGYEPVENPPIEVVDSPSLPPLHAVFGASRGPDGVWSLPPLSADLASPDAALHLGPIHVLGEAAATEAAEAALGGPAQVMSWHVMFVARGKVGPFVVATDSTVAGARAGVQWTLRDLGNDARPVATGTALFVRAGRGVTPS
jgi:hypothetical protein